MSGMDVKPPSGTRDFLPDELSFREKIISTVRGAFACYGFLPLQTPAFERIETLTGKYGTEADTLIFKILKRGEQAASGEADLALRYDFTVPLARVVAAYQSRLSLPFRRYQIGPVWRADRPARGRFREFCQCDIDIVGSSSPLAEVEVVGALARALEDLGVRGYTFRINSRHVLTALMEICAIPMNQRPATLIALDKWDKVGAVGVQSELEGAEVPASSSSQLLELLTARDDLPLRRSLQGSAVGRLGLAEVDTLVGLVGPSLRQGTAAFFPTLARGLDYYTGTIFEIFATGETLSLGSGGRYDGLVGMFTGKPTPACGGSLGIERIIELLRPASGSPSAGAPEVLVTVWDESFRADALRIADALRREGRPQLEVYLGEGDLGRQLRYAAKRRVRYCLIFGPDERANQTVTVKDLNQRTQRSFPLDEFAAVWHREFGTHQVPGQP